MRPTISTVRPTPTAATIPVRPRAIHLIDLENLIGDPFAGPGTIAGIWQAYTTGIGLHPGDHVIVATGPGMAATAWYVLPATGIQRRTKRGRDGADRALIEAVDLHHDARRFGMLIIASGDHIFEPLARQARTEGMSVWNIAGKGALARTLKAACPLRSRLRLTQPVAPSEQAA